MPLKKNYRRGGLAAAVALGVCALGPAVAQAACPTPAMSPAFAQFGDTAGYALAPGGSFEAGAPAWTLNGNTVVAENESFQLDAATDTQSLSIAPGTSVVSPVLCVDGTNPYLRLVAKKATKGSLKVEVLYTDEAGVQKAQNLGSVIQGGKNANGDYSDWAPSPLLKLSTALPLAKFADGSMNVQLSITADTEEGAWQVDDVYVDPRRGA